MLSGRGLVAVLSLTAALGAFLGGCGGPRTARGPSATFAAIQVQEARLERATTEAAELACEPASSATDEACVATDEICALAREARDADASTRCERAQQRCGAARRAHDARCAQGAP